LLESGGNMPNSLPPKLVHSIRAGQIVYGVDGKAYRVSSTLKVAGELAFKLADLQGRPCPTPADFFPIDGTRMHFASILKFAFNKDLTAIVNEMIEQAGLPTDPKMDWSKYLTKVYSAILNSVTTDPDIQDEVIYRTVVALLFERKQKNGKKILENFAEKVKGFAPETQKKPLEEQVSDYLKSTFIYYAKAHAKADAVELMRPEEMSMEQPGEEGETYNILDTEEHATAPSVGQYEGDRDITMFISHFLNWVATKETPKSAPNYAALLKIYWDQAQQSERGDVKISDLTQEWIRRTGLSFDSLKQYRDKLGSLIRDFVYENKAQLGNSYKLVDLLQHMFPPPPKAKARPAKASSAKPKCPHCGSGDYGLMPTDFETAKCNKCGKNWNHGIVEGINDPKTAAPQTSMDIHPPASERADYCDGCDRVKANCVCDDKTAALDPDDEYYGYKCAVCGDENFARTPGGSLVCMTCHPPKRSALGQCSCEWPECPLGHPAAGCMNPAAHKVEIYGTKTRLCQPCLSATIEYISLEQGGGDPGDEVKVLSSEDDNPPAPDSPTKCSTCGKECGSKICDECRAHYTKTSALVQPSVAFMNEHGIVTDFGQAQDMIQDGKVAGSIPRYGVWQSKPGVKGGRPQVVKTTNDLEEAKQFLGEKTASKYGDKIKKMEARRGETIEKTLKRADGEVTEKSVEKPTLQKIPNDGGFTPIAGIEKEGMLGHDFYDERTGETGIRPQITPGDTGRLPHGRTQGSEKPSCNCGITPWDSGIHKPWCNVNQHPREEHDLTAADIERDPQLETNENFDVKPDPLLETGPTYQNYGYAPAKGSERGRGETDHYDSNVEVLKKYEYAPFSGKAGKKQYWKSPIGTVVTLSPDGRWKHSDGTEGTLSGDLDNHLLKYHHKVVPRMGSELSGRSGGPDDVRGAGDLWREEFYQEGGSAMAPRIATSVKVLPCCGSITNHHKPDCKVYNQNFTDTLKKLYPEKFKKGDTIVSTTKTASDQWKVTIRDPKGKERYEQVKGPNYNSVERAVTKRMKDNEQVVSVTVAHKKDAAAAAPATPAAAPAAPAPAAPQPMAITQPPGTAIALPSQQDDKRPMRKTVVPELPGKKWHMTSGLTPEELDRKLVHVVTEYDRKQQGKRGYNPYALPQYLARVQEVLEDIKNGANVREAIVAGFLGRLQDVCLKAVGEAKGTDDEARGSGAWSYSPTKQGAEMKTASILEDAFEYFMEGKKDKHSGLGAVFNETYTRTGQGESKYMAVSKLMMDYEYAFQRQEDGSLSDEDNLREDAENALREIIQDEGVDDPNYSESDTPAKEMLKTEQNTQDMEMAVQELANTHPSTEIHERCEPVFEHGQWRVICGPCGAIWSVVDVEGAQGNQGLDLEEVEVGDESCQENFHKGSTEKKAFEPDAQSGIRGSNDGEYIFQADIYCGKCAQEIAADITAAGQAPENPQDETSYDSDDFPKGPGFDEESDSPQHCAGCHIFLENPLTTHGQEYMQSMVDEALAKGRGEEPHIKEWMDFYGYHPEEKDMQEHESSDASDKINALPQRGKPKTPVQLGLVEKSDTDLRLEGIPLRSSEEKEAAMDNKKAAEPTGKVDGGKYVTVTYVNNGIELSPTEQLKQELAQGGPQDAQTYADIWELMEDFFTNGWETIAPEDIGALTDGEIFQDPDGNVYWHERYQIESMLDELKAGNKVFMEYGGNMHEDEGEIAPPAEHQSSVEKEATGEMSQSEADDVEAWPMHHAIAKALGGTVKAFDQYQGPYVLVGSEIRGQGVYAPAIPMKGTVRLWIQSAEGADGAELQVYNEDNEKLSEPFWWEDTNAAVDAAMSVLDQPAQPAAKGKKQPAKRKGSEEKQAAPGDGGLQRDVQNQYENHPVVEMLWDYIKRDPSNKERVQTAWGTKTKQGLVLSVARALKDAPVSGE